MPTARLWRRIQDSYKRAEEEERAKSERWILETWSMAQAQFHALRFGDETPPTKEEHEKRKKAEKSGKEPPINWKEVEASREAMIESKERLLYALQGPAFFASWLGVGGVLEEPDESFEEFREKTQNAGKPDYDAQQAELDASNDRMRERVLREKREREHRRETEQS